MWEVIATVAVFGAAQIGLLLFALGQMWNTQKSHGERLGKLEETQQNLVADVARLQGEVGA